MWNVPLPKVDEKGIGTVIVYFNQGRPDEWSYSLGSFDLSSVKDLTPYADKVKAIHAADIAQQQAPNPYADMITALETNLNKA